MNETEGKNGSPLAANFIAAIQQAVVTKHGLLAMQVCVPKTWTDQQVIAFAESEYPAGTTNGWFIRKQGSPLLKGANERIACLNDKRVDFVHIMLDV